MDALSSHGESKGSAAALFSVLVVLSLGGFAPFAYMTAPIDRAAPEPGAEAVLRWFDASPMIYPRASPEVVDMPDGRMLVVGGLSTNGPTRTTEVYDPDTDSWTLGPNMTVARVGHTATLLQDGTVLIVGGETGSGTVASAEVLDLSKGACLYVQEMSVARCGHAAVALDDGRVLVVGGTDWMSGPWRQAEVYVPSAHSFSPAGSTSYGRVFLTLQTLPGGHVLAIGGDEVGSSEEFDPGSDSWGSYAQMGDKRYSASSTVLEGGNVLVAGGVSGETVLSSCEVYSADAGIWVTVGPMSAPRSDFGLAVAANGRVLAAGSWSSLGADGSSESMCQCDCAWRGEERMSVARGMQGTAITSNGTVLMVGGWDGSSPLSSVEMATLVQGDGTPHGMCEPMDLLPLVREVADELRGFSENGLVAKLFVAQAAYDCGRTGLCLDVLDAFYRQTCAFHRSGHLGDAGTSLLYDGYAEVVVCIGGEPLLPIV